MANTFKDISQFTLKSAATGTEEFQVSATEKVTAQQIANKVQLSQVIMSGFSALNFTGIEKIKNSNSLLGALAILYDLLGKGNIKMVSNGSTEYGFVSMGDVSGTTHGFGWLLSISEKAIYINNDFTSPNPSTLNNIQWVNTIKAGEKVSLDSGGIQTVTVTNFQTNVWNNDAGTNVFSSVPVGGMVVFKSAADATSGPGEALMGYAIKISSIIASYVGMTTTNGANVTPTLYTHKSSSLYATKWQKLPDADNAVQVTAFTESALSALISNYKTGDLIPFYTGNVTASADNQFPESGIFNGFISMGSNEGDYFQIFAFKTGSPNAYIGACIGSTTQWTALGDSSEGRGPIPGYKTLVSSWSSAVTTGSTGIINFREEIPQASRILVVAQIRSSPTGSATIRANVPLTLASINDSGQGILFDLSLQYLATGTNIGSIRLICTSLITGANGVQGMNTIVQSNNLANADDIIQLSLYYK